MPDTNTVDGKIEIMIDAAVELIKMAGDVDLSRALCGVLAELKKAELICGQLEG